MGVTWSQFFPPAPSFTEKELPDQTGRVFLITGGTSGVGLELARMLYAAGGKVYITARSEAKAVAAIETIRQTDDTRSEGRAAGLVDYVLLDYEDLSSVKASAQVFLAKESKLHVLWNNAGVSLSAQAGQKAKSGENYIQAVNILGPVLFTRLVMPALRAAAADEASSPAGSVRIAWTTTFFAELANPKGGFRMEDIKQPGKNRDADYDNSKLGNWFVANQWAAELRESAILSLVVSPGNLDTPLLKDMPWYMTPSKMLLYPAKMGAYAQLYAGISPELTMDDAGSYIIAFGRRHPAPRQDLLDALKAKEQGGTGLAKEYAAWCEGQVAKYI